MSSFQKLFKSVEGNREETVNYALSPMISGETNERLTQIPTAIEIKEALFSIHADKASGPDGFSAGFYHTNWENIGGEIVKEIQEFLHFRQAPRPNK